MNLLNRLIILLMLLCCFKTLTTYAVYGESSTTTSTPIHAKVLYLVHEEHQELGYAGDLKLTIQHFKVKILEGAHKNQSLIVKNTIDPTMAYHLFVYPNNHVLIYPEYDMSGELIGGAISDFVRSSSVYFIVGIFILTLLLIAGLKGLKTLVTLIVTIATIGFLFLPLLLKGYNPIFLAIITCMIVTILTFIILSGHHPKTYCAILGTLGGVSIAGILSMFIGNIAHLTGLSMDEAQRLAFLPQEINFNYKGLLFSGIIIGALGAVMDVSMSIASSIYEIKQAKPSISSKSLFKSGMNVGRDIMGTMSNTLILAYTGTSIPFMLILMGNKIPWNQIINLDIIASEIVRSLAGSIGLFLAVPLTAFIATLMYSKEPPRTNKRIDKDAHIKKSFEDLANQMRSEAAEQNKTYADQFGQHKKP